MNGAGTRVKKEKGQDVPMRRRRIRISGRNGHRILAPDRRDKVTTGSCRSIIELERRKGRARNVGSARR